MGFHTTLKRACWGFPDPPMSLQSIQPHGRSFSLGFGEYVELLALEPKRLLLWESSATEDSWFGTMTPPHIPSRTAGLFTFFLSTSVYQSCIGRGKKQVNIISTRNLKYAHSNYMQQAVVNVFYLHLLQKLYLLK